mgnify:CR=1 FL=1
MSIIPSGKTGLKRRVKMETNKENNNMCNCKNDACGCKGNCKCLKNKEFNRDNNIEEVKDVED